MWAKLHAEIYNTYKAFILSKIALTMPYGFNKWTNITSLRYKCAITKIPITIPRGIINMYKPYRGWQKTGSGYKFRNPKHVVPT